MNKTKIKTLFSFMKDNRLLPSDLIKNSFETEQKCRELNAFITLNEKEALIESENSSERHKAKQQKSLMDGIPIAIKDNFCTAGIKTSCGSNMLKDFVPTYNATVYERLKNAGAILIGKTNLDQFAMGSGTVDSIYGPARNIWRFNEGEDFYITGGSSGGSAVAVSAGIVKAAIGSDTGGSVRNPASYCGVVGLKPTYGLVSRFGLISLVNSMDVPGILTNNVDDCVEVLNVIAGPDDKDCTTVQRPFTKIRIPPGKNLSVKNLRIGIPKEYYSPHLSNEVYNTWKYIAELLEDSGAIIKQVSMPNTEYSIVCYSILNQCEVASNMARYDGIEFGLRPPENSSTEKLYASSRSLGFNEVVRNRILTGNYFLIEKNYDKYFQQALKVRRLIANDFDEVWNDVDFLLTPTTLTQAPKYEDFIKKTNRDQCALQDYCTQPANMAGVPAISLPITLSSDGLPLSLQIIGRNFSESRLLAFAKFIEYAVQFSSNYNINSL